MNGHGMNFRRMVYTMRQAQKAYFKQGGKYLLEVSKSWEKKVDDWLERNAQEEIKVQLYSNGRPMTEMPGLYTVHGGTDEERESVLLNELDGVYNLGDDEETKANPGE